MIQFEERPGILDLGWGHPRPALLPTAEWPVAAAASVAAFGWRALTYGYAAGPSPLTEWLAPRLGCTASSLFVTGGASHALALLASLLAAPGDVVLVDSPTYHLAFAMLADAGVTLVRAPADDDGVDPAALADRVRELRAAGRRIAFLYLVPTFANPTGRSLPPDRRRALAGLDLTIVEDDTYRELVYDGTAPPPLWNGANVIRVGSFAKTVAPGLRLGWINGTPELVTRLSERGYVHSGGGLNHTTALAMATFGTSGGYDTHLATVRSAYRAQRDALVSALRPGLPVDPPAGGWFLWLTLPPPWTAAALLPAAEARGVSFVPGSRFYLHGAGGEDRIRLSFSLLSPPELTEAAARLGAALTRDRPNTP